jgi:hypothetical protein
MRAALAALAALALLVLAAPASAQTWSPPQRLSEERGVFDAVPLGLAVSRDRAALAAWRFPAGVNSGVAAAARAPGADAFGARRRLVAPSSTGLVDGPVAYGRDGALLAVADERRVTVRRGHTDGTFGKARVLRRLDRGRVADVSLAAGPRGNAALAWFEDRGTRTDRVYVSLRPAGGSFGAPRRLATGRIRSVAAAVGASGDVLVAWDARGVLRTRFKPRRRTSFRATETIRSEDAFFAELHPVVTPNGRAVLAWSAQFASEGGDRGPVFFQVAVRPSGAQRFRRAELLERMPSDDEEGLGRPVDAVADPSGNVAVAWSGSDGPDRRVRVARVGQDGRMQPAQAVSAAGTDALLSDLAISPGGTLIAVWDGGVENTRGGVGAALAAAGGPFGPPEAVSPPGAFASAGVAAFAAERPTVVFAGTAVQATTRSG